MSKEILCFYKNTTSQLQIARISNIVNLHFEQIVFPGEQFLFAAVSEAELEIDVDTTTGLVAKKTIICGDLQVLS
ncbi:DUF1830 domain-containing protein [Anabaena sp. UHCC 0399]|uniref:DUF1830 domain-containing protein n=1 Tax=Anabaena sp. UHCC 0399 TaxID=3110238 RepID=UPI0016837A9B|nr:DUF1830 domain-containing protein [Anabaena sp. UHCC 0399]MBD2364626.1 DUF1830 domain-containing protein [Anabaena minutissima FACHB-250]MEA5565721.1 DUF1830 domain-containing protein [Anabaena sp. UHCC 0399]